MPQMREMRVQKSMPCTLHGENPCRTDAMQRLPSKMIPAPSTYLIAVTTLRLPRAHAIDADAAGKARGPRAEPALRLPQRRHLLVRHLAQRRRRPPALLDGRRRLAVRCQVEADEEQQVR